MIILCHRYFNVFTEQKISMLTVFQKNEQVLYQFRRNCQLGQSNTDSSGLENASQSAVLPRQQGAVDSVVGTDEREESSHCLHRGKE
jgi:hypothetical protein